MIYTHKLTGAKLRIKKRYGDVVSCYVEETFIFGWHVKVDVIVCNVNNLIKVL